MNKVLSKHYGLGTNVSYTDAVERVAKQIKKSKPAIDNDEPVPTFNVTQCSLILAMAFDIPHKDTLKDLMYLTTTW